MPGPAALSRPIPVSWPRPLLLVFLSLRCVLSRSLPNSTMYLGGSGRMGRNPSTQRQFRSSSVCLSLGDDCSVTYRALDLGGLPDLVGSVSRFRVGYCTLHDARFAAIEAMGRWGSLQPWKGPESNEEPNWNGRERREMQGLFVFCGGSSQADCCTGEDFAVIFPRLPNERVSRRLENYTFLRSRFCQGNATASSLGSWVVSSPALVVVVAGVLWNFRGPPATTSCV